MKTSYTYKGTKQNEEELANSIKLVIQEDAKALQVQEVLRAKTPVLERATKVDEQVELKKSLSEKTEKSPKPKNMEKPIKETMPETSKKEKKDKGKRIKFIFILMFLILLVATLFYLKSKVSIGKVTEQSVMKVVNSIGESKLGKSEKELSYLKNKLNDSKLPESEKKKLSGYLGTCSLYQKNSKELKGYESISYNIGNPNMTLSLSKINEDLSLYSVESLKSNINERIIGLQLAYTDYNNLRLELQGITDVFSFDSSKYATRIGNIKHTLNEKELQCIINTIVADKQVAEANTKLTNATTIEESTSAQALLDEAKVGQKNSQIKLEAIQSELEVSLKR